MPLGGQVIVETAGGRKADLGGLGACLTMGLTCYLALTMCVCQS